MVDGGLLRHIYIDGMYSEFLPARQIFFHYIPQMVINGTCYRNCVNFFTILSMILCLRYGYSTNIQVDCVEHRLLFYKLWWGSNASTESLTPAVKQLTRYFFHLEQQGHSN